MVVVALVIGMCIAGGLFVRDAGDKQRCQRRSAAASAVSAPTPTIRDGQACNPRPIAPGVGRLTRATMRISKGGRAFAGLWP